MLDACPHHHEDDNDSQAALALAADSALDGIRLRSPGESKPAVKKVWRTLDELAGTKSFETMVHREFPHLASEWKDEPSRRHFLKLMSASLALAGLSACTLRKPEEKIVPYVSQPEDVIPGRPLFFASTMPFAGYGKGVVVESHEGRPTKIEGNKDHPASPNGASDLWMQASVLELYDPDRSQNVMHGRSVSTWGNFIGAFQDEFAKLSASKGAGLRFLSGTVTSPTIARQAKALLTKYPNAKWHVFEPVGRKNEKAGTIQAFGQDYQTVYHFDKANVILSLESNFLTELPGSIAYAQDFVSGRRIRETGKDLEMNRLYVAEASVTVTGAQADHRLAIKSSDIEALATDLLAVLSGGTASGKYAKWAGVVAADLKKNAGKSLVVVGESQPPLVHVIGHQINAMLKNVGTTLTYTDPVEMPGDSLEELVADMNAGGVDTLFVIGTNPSYTAPRSFGLDRGVKEKTQADRVDAFKKNPLSKVRLIVNHSLFNGDNEETSSLCHWHIPASHYLESWGDIRSFDGTASVIQPLIYPLYTTKSEIELLAFLLGDYTSTAYDIVTETWTKVAAKLSEDDWACAREKGVVANTAFAAKTPALKPQPTLAPATSQPADKETMEIVFRPDPSIFDGRYANNGWLQELPKPITLLTWENVALISFNTAKRLGISQNDAGRGAEVPMVSLKVDGNTTEIPSLIMPGHADDSVTVYLGYGRTRVGFVGREKEYDTEKGVDVYALRTGDEWFASGLTVDVLSKTANVATAQSHHLIDKPESRNTELDQEWLEGRELIRSYKLEELNKGTDEEEKGTNGEGRKYASLSLPLFKPKPVEDAGGVVLPPWDYQYNKWGMVIDNQACIGCNACVIACQSENNIAIVGKEQVLKGREMHWIRIDTYFIGDAEGTPEVFHQPIPCMQCENAPCELVCPVEATTTSAEGINEQTYNRCVGTRYCSNNCPYKVRRFNFMEYTDYSTASIQLQRNPNVTVRARGIMEKCNFCVQRINNSRIEAKKQDRPINPGDVKTACEQSCPTQAISFGNLNDPRWEMTKLQSEPLRYTLLDDLNALPRVSYLGKVRNPNPEMTKI
jgi:molybdopterin-containing oxidoreductase family iron-sulfur binding subunit